MEIQTVSNLIIDDTCKNNYDTYKLAFYKINNIILLKQIINNTDKYNCHKFIINDLSYLNKCELMNIPNIIITNKKLTNIELELLIKYNIPIFYIEDNILLNRELFKENINTIKKLMYENKSLRYLYLFKKEIKRIENKYSNQLDKEKYIDSIIKEVLNLIKEKDILTYIHVVNVSNYVNIFEKGLPNNDKLTKEEIIFLKRTALLHDIGKLIIPNQILKKKTSLTPLEYSIMKSHVYEDVYPFTSEYMNKFKDIILSHHERYDGNGYIKGLSANNIPYYARILSILDAFEAMSGKRIYIQNRKSINEILNNLINNAGTQFDPDLLNIFINGITNKSIIKDNSKKLVLSR